MICYDKDGPPTPETLKQAIAETPGAAAVTACDVLEAQDALIRMLGTNPFVCTLTKRSPAYWAVPKQPKKSSIDLHKIGDDIAWTLGIDPNRITIVKTDASDVTFTVAPSLFPETLDWDVLRSRPPAITISTFSDDAATKATVDLSHATQLTPEQVTGVPYHGGRSGGWNSPWTPQEPSGDVRSFMIITRFGLDHAITYAFLEGAPTVETVVTWVERQTDALNAKAVVVDLGQSFGSLDEAADEASRLKEATPRANVISGRLE